MQFDRNDKELLLSTTHELDGYVITEYIDIISSEVVYKVSFSKALSQMLTDTVDSWRLFSSNELRGTTSLIQEAKDYVKGELVKKAKSLNANAIVGIDIETSISNDGIAKASISGTAVKIMASDSFKTPVEIIVKNYNPDLSFRVTKIYYLSKNEKVYVRLHLVSNSSGPVTISALKANLRFGTIFGDSREFTSLCFTSFYQEGRELASSSVEINCTPEVLSTINFSEVIVDKYIQNGNLKTASNNNVNIDMLDTEVVADNSASVSSFLHTLDGLNSASEILKYLKSLDPNTFHPEALSIAASLARSEKLYGNMKKDCISKIKKFYNK